MKKQCLKDFPEQIYRSNISGNFLFKETTKEIISTFSQAHELGLLFAKRNIKSKYRQSLLGLFWSLLPPLATAFIWIVLQGTNVINLNVPGVSYPLFVITGVMLWSIFTQSVLMPLQIVQANRSILVKINFPRESLLVSAFYEVVFNAIIALLIILFSSIFFGIFSLKGFLILLPSVFSIIVFGMSVGMLLLPVSLLYKDIQLLMPTFLQFLMYLTPVVYSIPVNSEISFWFKINPVAPLITNARGWFLEILPLFSTGHFSLIIILGIFLMFIGINIQRITMQLLIERMGS